MRRAVYAFESGPLVAGPVFMPVEYAALIERGWTAVQAVRTAGDARALPWPFDRLAWHLDEPSEVWDEETDDWVLVDPPADEDALREGWDAAAWEGDYPFRTYCPWEGAGTPYDYDRWMPDGVLELAEFAPLTSPMQETIRWEFQERDFERAKKRLRAAGWDVSERLGDAAVALVGHGGP